MVTYFISFNISFVASVAAYYLCKWLDKKFANE